MNIGLCLIKLGGGAEKLWKHKEGFSHRVGKSIFPCKLLNTEKVLLLDKKP